MIILLISLIITYQYITKGKVSYLKTIPFSIYLGWISVATIANISSALYIASWSALGFSGQIWSSLMISIATLLTVLILNIKKDVIYALVILWSVIGIMYKFAIDSDLIVGASFVSIVVILGSILYTTYKGIK
jgi:hypothetical protein